MAYPRHMTLELTAKCNFRCPYCYCVWHEYPALAKPELDAAGWMAILDKCAADGVEDILFTGGEALLRPDLEECGLEVQAPQNPSCDIASGASDIQRDDGNTQELQAAPCRCRKGVGA